MRLKLKLVLALFCCTFVLLSPWLDIFVSNFFFTKGSFSRSDFYLFIRSSANFGSNVLLYSSIFSIIASFWYKNLRKYHLGFFLILLVPIISYQLLHKPIKNNWGRPRPINIKEFGGEVKFQPFYKPMFITSKDKTSYNSFPSSHCAKSFEVAILIVIGCIYRNYYVLYCGIFFTVFYGGLQAIASIATGRHFLSDTIFPLVLTLIVASFVYYLAVFAIKTLEPNVKNTTKTDFPLT
ncbi:phosphatase PAP2 family protein [Candidatus Uabimicrobium sp. HlEnr_7]|uniref:phosphatase PAP2 family protein n=1 Tax=Candidatus Uabimicrobium helgolandensis TaxID=3095367 RepID=UPI003556BDB2